MIADFYINRNQKRRSFGWAWPSQETLERFTGISRRTIGKAIDELEFKKLIIVDHGGGPMGNGRRVNRLTLRFDCLDNFLPNSPYRDLSPSCGSTAETKSHHFHDLDQDRLDGVSEKNDREMGNLQRKVMQKIPMTLLKDSLENSAYRPGSKAATERKPRQQAFNRKKEASEPIQPFPVEEKNEVTSIDHHELAKLVGGGDVASGWEILQRLSADVFEGIVERYRKDKSSAGTILKEVHAQLASNPLATGSGDQALEGH